MSIIINVLIGLVGLALILLALAGAFAIVVAVSWLVGKGICKVFGEGVREYHGLFGDHYTRPYSSIGFLFTFVVGTFILLLYLLGSVIGRGIGL